MKYNIIYLLLLLMLTGCAASNSQQNDILAQQSFELAELDFRKQGVSPENRPYMKEACRGFLLSEKQVRSFFALSEAVQEKDLDSNVQMLPCHSIGTANINNEQYSWIIRAGGIGEFYNEKNKFYKICGKECCQKNPGLC